jgi:hypothetical protein
VLARFNLGAFEIAFFETGWRMPGHMPQTTAASRVKVVAMRSGIWPERKNKTEIGLTLNLLNMTQNNA